MEVGMNSRVRQRRLNTGDSLILSIEVLVPKFCVYRTSLRWCRGGRTAYGSAFIFQLVFVANLNIHICNTTTLSFQHSLSVFMTKRSNLNRLLPRSRASPTTWRSQTTKEIGGDRVFTALMEIWYAQRRCRVDGGWLLWNEHGTYCIFFIFSDSIRT